MQEKSTDELDAQLRNTTPDCMDKYYKENRYYIAETSKAFTYYMKDVIDKKNLAFCHSKLYYKDIYSFAGVSESYGEAYEKSRFDHSILCGGTISIE